MLGSHIVGRIRHGLETEDRGVVDDRTAAALEHRGRLVLHHVEDALEVDIDDLAEILVRGGVDGIEGALQAGVVESAI
ncbi:hypothetical protein D3C72_2413690 [compost metagenome]